MRILRVAVANITTHPHSPETYVKLFNNLFGLMKSVKVRGSDHLILGQFTPLIPSEPTEGIWGQFFRYVNIDKSLPSLDLNSLKPIISKDGSATITIPDNIKPNLRTVDFVFFPRGHRLFFNIDHLSPYSAQTAFFTLLNCFEISEAFGDVNVIVEQTTNFLEEIRRLDSLTKLSMTFTMPNADDLSHVKDEIAQRFGVRVNAKKVREELTGDRNNGLRPEEDEETAAMMELSLSNGELVAGGFVDGDKVLYRSKAHPEILTERYNPKTTPEHYALQMLATRALPKFTKKG